MITAIAILVSLGLFSFNYWINKDIYYPPALFSFIWTAILIIYIIFALAHGDADYYIDDRCFIFFIGGQVMFTLGGLFAVDRKIKREEVSYKPVVAYRFDKYIFWFLVLMLPVYILRLLQVAGASSISDANIFVVLRYEFVEEGIDIGWVKYLNYIALFGFAVVLYRFYFTEVRATRREQLFKYVFYFVVFIYCVLSTGRTYLLFMFCIYLGFKITAKKFKAYYYAIILAASVVLFATFALVLHKAGGESLSLSENIASVFSSVLDYLLGGVYAFNSVVRSGFRLDYGENTFRFFFAAANSLGITDSKPKELVMPFINNPVISNVYSVYYPYVKDFWYFGILFNGLWAYIHSWLYYRVKRNFIILFLYSILLYPLIMSFFQDQYMSLFSTWLQMLLLGCIALPFIRYSHPSRSSIQLPLIHA